MTLLPSDVLNKYKENSKQEYYHNWLYSVVPATQAFTKLQNNLSMFLTGYCKNCTNVFSVIIPHFETGEYRQTLVPIPKTGCIPV